MMSAFAIQNYKNPQTDLHAEPLTRTQLSNDIYALLPRASERVAVFCAEMLISTGTMTPVLAYAFLARGDASTRVALAGAEHLPQSIIPIALCMAASMKRVRSRAGLNLMRSQSRHWLIVMIR